jgi:hypothetical protein
MNMIIKNYRMAVISLLTAIVVSVSSCTQDFEELNTDKTKLTVLTSTELPYLMPFGVIRLLKIYFLTYILNILLLLLPISLPIDILSVLIGCSGTGFQSIQRLYLNLKLC